MADNVKPAPKGWGQTAAGKRGRLNRLYPTIEDLRRRARRRVPRFGFDYVDGGAGGEAGVARNRAALDAVELVPRYSRDITNIDMSVDLFGRRYAAPVGIAPMGMACLAWPGLEMALARAAEAANIPYVLACVGGAAIERIAEAAPNSFWFQLYRFPRDDHAVGFDLLRRAKEAGAHTVSLTVDSPVRTRRPRDLRNGVMVPFRLTPRTLYETVTSPAWALAVLRNGVPRFENFVPYCGASPNGGLLASFAQNEIKESYSWEEIARIRELWPRGLLVKGIMHPEDAAQAVKLGVDGVYVSNHGGRQFEAAPATADVLPAIVAEVGGKAAVLFDSGIRSGLDVVRAVALGARAAFTGRSFAYGVAALGTDGARHVADLLIDETRLALGQLGARTLAEVSGFKRRHDTAMKF